MQTAKKRGKNQERRTGPETRDLHRLYEMAVQSPDVNADFFDRVYRSINDKTPKTLKEDFCGTALLSAEWVRKRKDNIAIGVDLDGPTLQWAREHNIAPLGEDASRVQLVEDDVRKVTKPKVDVIAALNFSYFIFKQPDALTEYYKTVRSSLNKDGIFVMDIFGGWEAQMDLVDKTKNEGFTYEWEQKGINPITNEGIFHIHFKFHGGGGIKKAFTYDWRLWSIPEVQQCLEAAGFKTVDVYWEGIDSDTDEGNGVFRKVTKVENCPGWHTFIVAY
ncbi:MAG: class I SAM-dependent methyltransferase [bacterium]|nr:class I SAM-dependent methyltransferase [bacterium]